MAKRKKQESKEEECTIALAVIPVLPVVNNDAMFWKNIQESSEGKQKCRRRNPPLPYHCKHCLAVMNQLPMTMETLIHLASDPNHLELMRAYDGVKDTRYFIETLFHMNRMVGHCAPPA